MKNKVLADRSVELALHLGGDLRNSTVPVAVAPHGACARVQRVDAMPRLIVDDDFAFHLTNQQLLLSCLRLHPRTSLSWESDKGRLPRRETAGRHVRV